LIYYHIKKVLKYPKIGHLKGKFAAHNPHNPKVGGSSPSSATKSSFSFIYSKKSNFALKKIIYEL